MFHEILVFFGRAICHQFEERSLTISGEVLSVCARDTGMYIGIFSTLSYLKLFKKNKKITIPSVKVSFCILLLLVPLMIDGLGSYLHLFESNNLRRLVTGISFGFVLPYYLYPLLSNTALEQKSEPVIIHSKDLFIPLLLSSFLGGVYYWGQLPHIVLDSLIITAILIWILARCLNTNPTRSPEERKVDTSANRAEQDTGGNAI
jgi:uncharacterized membrane protein